ncbi:gas vesicle protein GvpA/GvpJ/GvpM family [Salsuginibacillus halophilus]|uniref:Gas vesicle protein GvpA/GvpJ/GvpM family n=1 Tax=Salsuginibacillus halophilus TaxID=517424 RepID=A0A2P8HLI7_9BACI|nr:gas vesicle protein GvpJ [Salsuginibacillus halophilus]PSL47085.1 gas vesicle protein GvpA/GvpJ/GvpM family [Salsuginibacillus halophilus]
MEHEVLNGQDVTLVDVLDTVLDKGVVLQGSLVITVAGIDLVYIDLKLLVSSVETLLNAAEKHNEIQTSGGE